MFYLYDNVYHLGVYNPKNLGNDKLTIQSVVTERGVYNPKNLGNDKLNHTIGVYDPKILGNDKRKATSSNYVIRCLRPQNFK